MLAPDGLYVIGVERVKVLHLSCHASSLVLLQQCLSLAFACKYQHRMYFLCRLLFGPHFVLLRSKVAPKPTGMAWHGHQTGAAQSTVSGGPADSGFSDSRAPHSNILDMLLLHQSTSERHIVCVHLHTAAWPAVFSTPWTCMH